VSFSVSDTEHLSMTKDLLLRHARRQLYYSGLYFPQNDDETRTPDDSTAPPNQRLFPLLREIVLFEPLEAQQLADLAAQLKPRLLEPEEVLFAQGGTEATLYIVASGILQINQNTASSGSQLAGFIGAGDYVGEISLLTGAPYAATAKARTHCKLYGLGCSVVKPLLTSNSNLYAEFDRSARRGLGILNRAVAVRATEDGASQSLLHRIRAFFDNSR
jgi:CRP-like cAMP-binding protein